MHSSIICHQNLFPDIFYSLIIVILSISTGSNFKSSSTGQPYIYRETLVIALDLISALVNNIISFSNISMCT